MTYSHRYSVIIPHYCSEEFLKRCLHSIPVRNDIQIIVVDDNSPNRDNTLAVIVEEYQNVDFILLDKNGGAGKARNEGLNIATGRWLIFADADDFFPTDAWTIFDNYVDTDYDIIYFLASSIDAVSLTPVERASTYNVLINACDNVSPDTINRLKFRHDVPWGKMIQHDLVKKYNIKFDETKYCNDTIFSTLTALKAQQTFAVKSITYYVTENTQSLTHQTSKEANLIRFEVILRKNLLLKTYNFNYLSLPILSYIIYAFRTKNLSYIRLCIHLGRKYKACYMNECLKAIKRFYKRLVLKEHLDLTNV